ncbi:immunoglobulin-like domain-containing protein, partial [Clostridium sp.]
MKEYKRIISIFLVVAIAFLQIPNLIAYAAADATPPTIDVSTLKVDKTEATVGGKVKLSFKATDKESGIKSIYVNYKKPITGDGYGVKMNYNTSEDIYEVYINVDNNTQNGVWKINYINLTDNNENRIDIWNSNVTSISPNKEDLSAGNFTVIDDSDPVTPIEGATIVTNNESWSNKTIEGDLYIGPEAVLNVTNTVVKGNIYALGSLKSNGGLSVQGTIYGREMHWGGNPTLYNGTIVVYGANSIYSSVMTTYPVTDIPVRIDNTPLKAIDGKLDILGATIDVADMYIEGNKYDIGYKGKIRIYDLNVGDKDTVTIKFKTVFGNEIVKDYKVDHYVTSPSGKINKLPVISGADDLTIKLGDSFDPKAAVIATDAEDGDITSSIVISGQVDTNKVGEYKLTYSVTDSYESKVTKERKITVRTNEKPAISGTSDMTIKVGDSFDPKAGVTASDVADGLAATPLATYKNAPLLLTEANTLPEVTKSEIKRLSAKNAIIVG